MAGLRLLAATMALGLMTALTWAQGALPVQEKGYVGFDSNEYPGDGALRELRKQFAFAGYWLTNPPGAHSNGWKGKREVLVRQGFGFLVLANGRFDREIKKAGISPASLGQKDAAVAVAAAHREGFPLRTVIFLDQEEGGRLLPEQMGYLLAWTEAVAAAGYRPGVYASGQPVHDDPGATITTVRDIRDHVAAGHLHEVAMWVYEDDCPPAPGCTLQPLPLNQSGTPGAIVWQYAQSPRRSKNTASCARTYAADGNCYGAGSPGFAIDLNVASSADPSEGR